MSSARLDDKCMGIVRTFMDGRRGFDESAVSDARYMMEAIHGDEAAMASVAIACDRLLDDKYDETRFWMRVYRSIVGASDCEGSIALH